MSREQRLKLAENLLNKIEAIEFSQIAFGGRYQLVQPMRAEAYLNPDKAFQELVAQRGDAPPASVFSLPNSGMISRLSRFTNWSMPRRVTYGECSCCRRLRNASPPRKFMDD